MSKILCIETSTEICSVALSENVNVTDFREDITGQNHSRLLTVFINDLLSSNNLNATELDAVAVSEGPGSYTGLRIGVSVAKGICYASSIPLIAVSPLESMTYHVIANMTSFGFNIMPDDVFIPMIDARRMEVYTEVFNAGRERISAVEPVIIDENSFSSYDNNRVFYFGNGALKCSAVLKAENLNFIDGIITSARNMCSLAYQKYELKHFVDVAYFEPFYLKDFVATVGKRKVV